MTKDIKNVRRLLMRYEARKIIIYLSNGPRNYTDMLKSLLLEGYTLYKASVKMIHELKKRGIVEMICGTDKCQLTKEGVSEIVQGLKEEISELSEILKKLSTEV